MSTEPRDHLDKTAPRAGHTSRPDAAVLDPSLRFPPLARFRFHCEAQDALRLPDYAGSAWRGLLGNGLRRTACVTRQPTCARCLLIQHCVYSTFFETPPPPTYTQKGYTAMAHPYVLDLDPTAPRALEPGVSFDLTLHLLGTAITQVPYLIHALTLAGQQGFGRARQRFVLCRLERERTPGDGIWNQIYDHREGTYQPQETRPLHPPEPPLDEVRIRLVTPLRLKRQGHFVGARDLAAADFIQTLLRRLHQLAILYGGDPDAFDPRQRPLDLATLQCQPLGLRWHEWTRYSSRQDSLMQFGGLIGEIRLAGPALLDLWPALWFGQWTHVGKGTAFGLGGYRIISGESRVAEADITQACETRP